jgi:ribosomal protein L11 methyltransferase
MLTGILPFPPETRLLDVGCGSGILALAAAAQGAHRCAAVDLSPAAARLTRDNARANGLAGVLTVVRGSTECLRGPFQVILANLPAPVQLAKVAELCRLAAPEGVLLLSGFRDTQEEELRAAYAAAGWGVQRRATRDEWAMELPPEKSFTWVAWLLGRETL